jgi:hypothetical protein
LVAKEPKWIKIETRPKQQWATYVTESETDHETLFPGQKKLKKSWKKVEKKFATTRKIVGKLKTKAIQDRNHICKLFSIFANYFPTIFRFRKLFSNYFPTIFRFRKLFSNFFFVPGTMFHGPFLIHIVSVVGSGLGPIWPTLDFSRPITKI